MSAGAGRPAGDDTPKFEARNREMVRRMGADPEVRRLTREWLAATAPYEYAHHFRWLGLPVIQLPQDLLALQEIIWETRPELIVETGVARGGSLVFHASMLHLLGGDGHVMGVDVAIRPHNRAAIEGHPLAHRITLVEGSSTDEATLERVRDAARGRERVLVVLDSSHMHDHVLRELELYAPLVTPGSYLVVLDTIIEEMAEDTLADRPWGKGNSPRTAVRAFLKDNPRFEVDREIEEKLLATVAPGGYLRCIAD